MMTSLAALLRRAIPAAGGLAAAASAVLLLSGCAAGAGSGADVETLPATETAVDEPTAAPDDRMDANVVVLDASYDQGAGTIEVSSIITNHISEGTCIVTATSSEGDEQVTEVEALPDAQSTVCPTTMLTGLAPGEWTVVVTFDSEDAAGSSEPTIAEEQ